MIRKFTGIPDDTDVNEFPISVHVDDGYLGAAKTTFWVTINTPPDFIATSSETSILIQAEELFSRSLSDWFYDADGHALTYQVTPSDGSPLPSWMTYTPNNTTLSGKPRQHDSGVHYLQVTADDAKGGQVTADASVRVNSKPILNYVIGSTYTAYVGEPFNLQLPYTAFIDADVGDILTYAAYQMHNATVQSPLSGWLSFNSDAQKFTGIPTSADKGKMNVTLEVSDGYGGVASVVLPFDVPNRSPNIPTEILPPSAQIWQCYEYTINPAVVVDLDGDTLTPIVRLHNGEPLSDWLHFDADKWLLYGCPGVIPWQGEDVNLRFQVSDGENIAEREFVVPVNMDYMLVLIGTIYAGTGGLFLASNLITKWSRACLLWKAERKLTEAAGHVASVESNPDLLQVSYSKMTQVLKEKGSDMRYVVTQYTEQMKHYFLTTSQAGDFDQVHPWHVIRDSISEIKQRIVTGASARNHRGYDRYFPMDVDWCASLALLLQSALLVQHHLGRKACYDERKKCQKELKTIMNAVKGNTEHAVAIAFHLACAQAALACMGDSYHWLSLGFLAHLGKVTFSPPHGIVALYATWKDIPSAWYLQLVMVQQLAETAKTGNSQAFNQLLTLRDASNDWRFVYNYTVAMQEIVVSCSNEGIRSQAQEQLQTLQQFNRFRFQRFNGLSFFQSCCQNRNQWIRRQAARDVAASAQVEMIVAPDVPLPPPPENRM